MNLILLRSRQTYINEKRLIFPSPKTHCERDPASIVRKLHRMQKRAGLPEIRFHDLRHSFATLSLAQGQDIKTISHMLGHTDAGFTMNTYMHVTDNMQEKVADALGDLIKEKEKHPYSNVVSFTA
ncbi:MAG: site-specific integrase [Clostridiaceae bacterium]|nr:site-specific integrase [Clostridiaceae bacterium]